MKPRISRLTPCPKELKWIIELVNEAPPEIELLDLAEQLPRLEEQYSELMNATAGVEDFEDEIYRDWRSIAGNIEKRIPKLLELHRPLACALRPFPEHSRIRLWEQALMPVHGLGPNGKLSEEALESQT